MFDIKAWAQYIVECVAKDPLWIPHDSDFGPDAIHHAVVETRKNEAKEREQKKKQKCQENIAKAKRTKKD